MVTCRHGTARKLHDGQRMNKELLVLTTDSHLCLVTDRTGHVHKQKYKIVIFNMGPIFCITLLNQNFVSLLLPSTNLLDDDSIARRQSSHNSVQASTRARMYRIDTHHETSSSFPIFPSSVKHCCSCDGVMAYFHPHSCRVLLRQGSCCAQRHHQ